MIAVAGGCGSAVVAIVDVAASAGGAVRPAAVGVAPAAFAGTDGLEQRSQLPFACIVNNRQRQVLREEGRRGAGIVHAGIEARCHCEQSGRERPTGNRDALKARDKETDPAANGLRCKKKKAAGKKEMRRRQFAGLTASGHEFPMSIRGLLRVCQSMRTS